MGASVYDLVNGGNAGTAVTNTGTLVMNNNATLVPNVTRAMDTNAEAVVTNTGARFANGISNFFAMPYVASNTKRTQDKLRKQTEPANSDKDYIVTDIAEFIWNQKNSVPSEPGNYGERYLADLNQIYDDKFKELEILARSATSFEKCKEIFEKGFEV